MQDEKGLLDVPKRLEKRRKRRLVVEILDSVDEVSHWNSNDRDAHVRDVLMIHSRKRHMLEIETINKQSR